MKIIPTLYRNPISITFLNPLPTKPTKNFYPSMTATMIMLPQLEEEIPQVTHSPKSTKEPLLVSY